jgi:hypothetical protein
MVADIGGLPVPEANFHASLEEAFGDVENAAPSPESQVSPDRGIDDAPGNFHRGLPAELVRIAEESAARSRLVDQQLLKAERYVEFFARNWPVLHGVGVPEEAAENFLMFSANKAFDSTAIRFLGPNPTRYNRPSASPTKDDIEREYEYEATDAKGTAD